MEPNLATPEHGIIALVITVLNYLLNIFHSRRRAKKRKDDIGAIVKAHVESSMRSYELTIESNERVSGGRLTKIENYLFGIDGSNGARSQLRILNEKVEGLVKQTGGIASGLREFIALMKPELVGKIDFGGD